MFSRAARRRTMESRWQGGQVATNAYLAATARAFHDGARVLQAGCGWDKNNVTAPHKDRCEVIGLDPDPSVAERFHSRFVRGSLETLPFPDAFFDVVVADYVIEHLHSPHQCLSEVARVLKPGGKFIAVTPNVYSYKSLVAAFSPQWFHELMGRARHERDVSADMYPTVYRCNSPRAIRRIAKDTGFAEVKIELLTNGPTWLVPFPGLFELGHLFHLLIDRVRSLNILRCAILLEAIKA